MLDLEVLYDTDYECKVVTDELNGTYFRLNMPNSQSVFIDCLAEIASKKIKEIVDKDLILNNN
ncbi:Ferrochelatase, protoheme ferro-lyase [Bacillus mycoides]|nr:Ferrochelatase 2 [Bacillus mycoides DSM 2048]KMQ14131.1 ferrochelatase [Bacillus mycoides]KUH46512.1 Ferrochelatase, protoheme ferro-lyase [Bacillus mycoides]OSY06063.1 Ferrochelatase, protoheme ferro-lyase [Bacillus mycoides]OSY16286.1 Ferrochelatase, protoheme ferro-lyase [Bacillus mycoides]